MSTIVMNAVPVIDRQSAAPPLHHYRMNNGFITIYLLSTVLCVIIMHVRYSLYYIMLLFTRPGAAA